MKKQEVLWTGLVLAFVLSLAMVGVANAQAPDDSPLPTPTVAPGWDVPVPPPPLNATVAKLAGAGGALLWGILLSQGLRKWKWFNAQTDEFKTYSVPVAALVLAIMAQVAVQYVPAAFWNATEPYWQTIAGAVSAWIGANFWHQLQKARVQPEAQF